MTMCIRERVDVRPWSAALAADIARDHAGSGTRRGAASAQAVLTCAARSRIADAFYAPVAFRFRTYGVAPDGRAGRLPRRRCSRIRCCANGKRRRSPKRRSSRPTSRASSIATSSRSAGAARDDRGGARRAGRSASARRPPSGRRCASAAAAPRISTGRRSRATSSTRAPCSGIVDYEPTELVVTARAGTPLARDRATRCARAGQMLAFEPPRFGAGATLGGVVAAGLSGPRRPTRARCAISSSACASSTATATTLAFGGRVMKNVAGFDVSRLMTGALGTLGVLTEVSLKCLPRPKVETTRVVRLRRRRSDPAGQRMGRQAAADLGDLPPRRPACACACRAPRPRSKRGAATIGGSRCRRSRRPFWRQRARPDARFLRGRVRGGTRAVAAVGEVDGAVTRSRRRAADRMGRRAALADRRAPRPMPQRVRAWAQQHGGHATLFRGADKSRGRIPAAVACDAGRCTSG